MAVRWFMILFVERSRIPGRNRTRGMFVRITRDIVRKCMLMKAHHHWRGHPRTAPFRSPRQPPIDRMQSTNRTKYLEIIQSESVPIICTDGSRLPDGGDSVRFEEPNDENKVVTASNAVVWRSFVESEPTPVKRHTHQRFSGHRLSTSSDV